MSLFLLLQLSSFSEFEEHFQIPTFVSCLYTLFQNGRQANWTLWPRSRLNILLNLTFESEAIRANLHGNKRILKCRPFWNKVCYIVSVNSYSKCHPGNSYNDDLKLEGSSGTLESPLYPSSYPPDITCTWVITVPHGKIVKLTFKSFDVDYEYSYCSGDYVEVKDGQFAASKLIGEYCGGSKPDDIRSSGRYLRVHFRSDSESYILNEGFEAKFQAVDKSKFCVRMNKTYAVRIVHDVEEKTLT